MGRIIIGGPYPPSNAIISGWVGASYYYNCKIALTVVMITKYVYIFVEAPGATAPLKSGHERGTSLSFDQICGQQ